MSDVRGFHNTEKLFIVGISMETLGHQDYKNMYGGFGFTERNEGGASTLDFAQYFGFMVANSGFPKREVHLDIFHSLEAKVQIDILLLKKCDRVL